MESRERGGPSTGITVMPGGTRSLVGLPSAQGEFSQSGKKDTSYVFHPVEAAAINYDAIHRKIGKRKAMR